MKSMQPPFSNAQLPKTPNICYSLLGIKCFFISLNSYRYVCVVSDCSQDNVGGSLSPTRKKRLEIASMPTIQRDPCRASGRKDPVIASSKDILGYFHPFVVQVVAGQHPVAGSSAVVDADVDVVDE